MRARAPSAGAREGGFDAQPAMTTANATQVQFLMKISSSNEPRF
jgi:hypothetical protein